MAVFKRLRRGSPGAGTADAHPLYIYHLIITGRGGIHNTAAEDFLTFTGFFAKRKRKFKISLAILYPVCYYI